MKNLKKVLALVVVFSMMLGTVAFAAFPDVAEDAYYANAVNTLAALEIIGGDDQGNFNPDNTITRAEFTKIVCEMQGIKGDAGKGATIFTDVAADHWASGYINMAVGMGIINGMGDGTFAPSAPVTYEQAIKMIVVALGYEPMAADRGGYPTGYLAAAQAAGLTKGIKAPAQTDAAIRSLVAELVYNALDVPMMQQTGFGSDKTFEVMDGSKDKDRVTLLTSKFEVVKLGGVVTANDKVDMIAGADLAEGKINFRIYNNYKTAEKDFTFSNAEALAGYKDVTGIDAEGTIAEELIGAKATIFVQEDNNKWTVIAAIADAAANSMELAFSDIDTGARTDITTAGKKTIAYYVDGAKNSVKLAIEDAPIILWNNVTGKTLNDVITAAATRAATITLTDWNDDDKFDAINVAEYRHYVVEDINENTLRINKRFRLDAEEVEYDISIKDADGNDVAFEDIALGDVIAVMSDSANINAPWNAVKYIDIVVLGASVVEGTVTAWDANNASGAKATIGDATYTVSSEYTEGKIDIAKEGAFYLDINGKIFAYDGTKAASGNLGIILKAAVVASGVDANVAQVKMLTKDGEIVVYNLAETVKVNAGTTSGTEATISYKRADATADPYTDLAGTGFAGGSDNVTIGDHFAAIFGTDLAYNSANFEDRIVQYKANANGEITELTPNGVYQSFTVDTTNAASAAAYNANTMKLGAGRLDDNTTIFSINKGDITKSKVVGAGALIDDANYKFIVVEEYDVDEAIALVVLDGGNALGASVEGMAVVTGVAKTRDANDEDAYTITLVENGVNEEKDILVTVDTQLADDYSAAYGAATATTLVGNANFGVGSVLLYTADEEGNATVIAPIANVVNNVFVPVGSINLAFGAAYGSGSDANKYRAGIANGEFDKNEIPTTAGLIEIESATNEYRVYNAGRTTTVDVGSYAGGNVADAEYVNNKLMGNAFLARYVDGDVVDVIAIDTRVVVEDYAANVTYHAAAGTYLGIACDPYTVAFDVISDNLLNGDYKLEVTKGADTWVALAPGCVNMDNLCVSFNLPVGIGGAFDEAPAGWVPGAPAAGTYTVNLYKGDVVVGTYTFVVA